MRIILELFKRSTIELPEVVFEVFDRVYTRVMELEDSVAKKFLENDDLAASWILSMVSQYDKSVDYAFATIDNGTTHLSIGLFVRNKFSRQILIAPRVAKLHRVIYLPDSVDTEQTFLREATISSFDKNVRIYVPPSEYYIFETVFIPKVSRGTIIFEHDYGDTLIDIKEFLENRTQSESHSKTGRSGRRAKSKRSSRKSSRRRRVASSK